MSRETCNLTHLSVGEQSLSSTGLEVYKETNHRIIGITTQIEEVVQLLMAYFAALKIINIKFDKISNEYQILCGSFYWIFYVKPQRTWGSIGKEISLDSYVAIA